MAGGHKAAEAIDTKTTGNRRARAPGRALCRPIGNRRWSAHPGSVFLFAKRKAYRLLTGT